jgi:hypothetical protein
MLRAGTPRFPHRRARLTIQQRTLKESPGQIDYGSQPHTGASEIAWRRGTIFY